MSSIEFTAEMMLFKCLRDVRLKRGDGGRLADL
jgi:hypothetical protein